MFTKPNKNSLKLITLTLLCLFSGFVFSASSAYLTHAKNSSSNPKDTSSKPITIGIIVPLEHTALRDIVEGFKSVVGQKYPEAVFKVQNAQGDIKLQRNIIELFVGQKVDMIVPIGTTTTQMTLSLVKKQPIVSLAPQYSEEERLKRQPRNITGVLDEIGAKRKLEMLAEVIPHLKKMTVIFHSGNEKNFKEFEELEGYCQKQAIDVQKMVIQSLPELETAAKAIATDSEAILVFKDHLVVSGIRLLVPTAEERGIPLVTGDEGSVGEGAAFALAVSERAIGEAGGKLAVEVLRGKPIEDLPMEEMQDLTVFYNKQALQSQKVDYTKLKDYAEKNDYHFVAVSPAS
jgi:putative ABC transport system substrate-binding protein